MNKPLCIYHANCADGLGAAWAVHKALSPDVEFIAAQYGDKHLPNHPPAFHDIYSDGFCDDCIHERIAGRDVLIVDFSYPLNVLRAMAQEARSVLVLDHYKYKTVQEDLLTVPVLQMPVSSWLAKDVSRAAGNLAAIFDLDRNGAGLTWDYLHHGVPRPRIIDLIEDHDIWKFKFGEESRTFHAVLSSYDWKDLPTMFKLFDSWHSDGSATSHLTAHGYSIHRAHKQAVKAAVAASRRTIKITGHIVPCANVPPSMASDAGQLLCHPPCKCVSTHEDCQNTGYDMPLPFFSATYYDGSDGRRHFSLRSPEGGADVGQIAKQMAALFNTGGGHVHTAWFDAPLNWEGE